MGGFGVAVSQHNDVGNGKGVSRKVCRMVDVEASVNIFQRFPVSQRRGIYKLVIVPLHIQPHSPQSVQRLKAVVPCFLTVFELVNGKGAFRLGRGLLGGFLLLLGLLQMTLPCFFFHAENAALCGVFGDLVGVQNCALGVVLIDTVDLHALIFKEPAGGFFLQGQHPVPFIAVFVHFLYGDCGVGHGQLGLLHTLHNAVLQDISLCCQRVKRSLRYLAGNLHIGVHQHLQGGLYLVADRLLLFGVKAFKYGAFFLRRFPLLLKLTEMPVNLGNQFACGGADGFKGSL